MASDTAINKRRLTALEAIGVEAEAISKQLNIDPPALMTRRGRSRALTEAQNLQALAVWMATLTKALPKRKTKKTKAAVNGDVIDG